MPQLQVPPSQGGRHHVPQTTVLRMSARLTAMLPSLGLELNKGVLRLVGLTIELLLQSCRGVAGAELNC